MNTPKILTADDLSFPDVNLALDEPNGLLAIGGTLDAMQLTKAYQKGIFPWYLPGQPILWWSPDPRAVLFLDEFKINRSLSKVLRHKNFEVTMDKNFMAVIHHCSLPRVKEKETWITDEIQSVYGELHQKGLAHSVEVWYEKNLVGGLYGVDCGRIFAGESMFSLKNDAAKVALVHLVSFLKQLGYALIDCQINNHFLQQFGARDIRRDEFIKLLKNSCRTTNAKY